MSALRDVAEDYLRMRRALGYKLEIQGLLLNGFISYLEQAGATTVTIENAVAWATLLLSAVQFRHEMAPSRRSRWGRRDRASRPALARLW